jgi:hypothetical protein
MELEAKTLHHVSQELNSTGDALGRDVFYRILDETV